MKLKIGLALYSLLEELKQDYMGTLERVAALGYKYVEYVGTPVDGEGKPVATPEEIGNKVRELGLIPISSHVMMSGDSDLDQIIEDQKKMGTQAIILPFAHMYTMEQVEAIADLCNRMGKKCKDNGMDFYYHNHCQEFVMVDGKTAMDRLLEMTDPELVSIELDTYWVERAGLCPTKMIKQLGSRCKRIHQKDLNKTAENVNLLEGLEAPVTQDSMMAKLFSTKPDDIVPVGTGAMDIASICRTTEAMDYAQYIIVELDSVSRMTEEDHGDGLSPLQSVELSLKNLSAIVEMA